MSVTTLGPAARSVVAPARQPVDTIGPRGADGAAPTGPGRGPVDPRLLRRAAPVRIQLVLGAVLGALTAVCVVIIAGAVATGVGAAFARHSLPPIIAVTGWLAAGFAGRAVLAWGSDVLAARTSAAVKSELRRDILAAYLRPGARQPDRGTMIDLVTTGLDDLDGYFGRFLPHLVLAVVVPAVIGVAIAARDLPSAVIIAGTLPLIPVFMVLVGWSTQQRTDRRWLVQARLAHHFVDLVGGLPTLQAFGRARSQLQGLRRSGEAHRAETMATLRIALLSALVLELSATLSVAIVAVVMGLRVITGGVDLTTALFVLVLAPEAYLPLRKVGVHYHEAADGMAAVRTAFELIDAGAGQPASGPLEVPAGAPQVRLAGVAVQRGDHRLPGPGGVELTAPAGRLTVLTGPSGGGKSSLLAVLMGWSAPASGRVLIDGIDLSALDRERLGRMIAWVGQEPALLDGTVADNVRLGLPTATAGQVVEALRAAGTDLDPGRRIGEQRPVSAGERRRIALARAWLRVRHGGARLMILDEPTAGLDEQTELAALAAVTGLPATVLMVSHRPAVLAAADQVVLIGAHR